MKCIAIDDEPLALDIIEKYISKIPELELTGRFTSALDALEIIKAQEIDIIFLDIQMSDITGIDFLKSLTNPPLIIFTTAYENYALEGYELNVLDYLLKPFAFDRFLKAVNKAQDYLSLQKGKSTTQESVSRDFIFVRSEYQLIKINLNDIKYIEGLKDYVKIFCGPKPVLAHQNLKNIESKIPADQFIRVHKSYIISLKKVQAIQKNMVLVDGVEIPLGDSYRENLFKHINENQ